jgi:hypothetical protein
MDATRFLPKGFATLTLREQPDKNQRPPVTHRRAAIGLGRPGGTAAIVKIATNCQKNIASTRTIFRIREGPGKFSG